MAHGSRETEIKLAVRSAALARHLLREAGLRISRPRVFEANTIFDTPRGTLRKAGALLRVREAGRAATLTYKGAATVTRHKTREELEVGISEAPITQKLIERLGFQPAFRYEKFRTEYQPAAGAGVAMLDETPIGVYLELEGSPHWIDRTARQMGFTAKDYSTATYAWLYMDWCRQRGVKPSHMVFPRKRARRG
ncbi:MAG TPA: class IV adenylate cyclase [Bryobacteraceae bacterium]|nr:class IV adenylate cyclase [Bryobacteraceae bacterium]